MYDPTAGYYPPLHVDCRTCGHPLLQRYGQPWCAVGGSHGSHMIRIVELEDGVLRNVNAEGSSLVDQLTEMPLPAGIKRTRLADYHRMGVA